MTNKKAIRLLSKYIDNDCYTKDFQKCCEFAITALKKQIPKTPKDLYSEKMLNEKELAYFGDCPCCGLEMQPGENFCSNCGQALDWSGLNG